jgi:hypothetical protein
LLTKDNPLRRTVLDWIRMVAALNTFTLAASVEATRLRPETRLRGPDDAMTTTAVHDFEMARPWSWF